MRNMIFRGYDVVEHSDGRCAVGQARSWPPEGRRKVMAKDDAAGAWSADYAEMRRVVQREGPTLERRHRALYGDLDPFAVAPFVRYGEPLSGEGLRLARLLDRARTDESRLAWDIKIELAQLLAATRLYDMALHRQKLVTLLERYSRELSPLWRSR